MRPSRAAWAPVTLLVGLAACAPPPATQFEIVRPLSLQRCAPTFMAQPRARLEALLADQPTTLDFVVSAFLDCESGRREVESISVELIDDGGAPIAALVDVEGRGPSRFVKVSFTAPASGTVHLRLVAEPTIGVFSQSLRILRRSSRTWVELPSRSCDGLVDGPGGEPLCVNAGRLEFANRVVPVDGVAVTSSMVWLAQSTMLEGFFSDGGTGVRVPLPTRIWAIGARGRQVAVSSFGAITTVDEAGAVRTLALQEGFLVQALGWWDDDTLLIGNPSGFDRVSLDGSVPARPFAGQVPFQLMGTEGLWSLDSNETLTLHRLDGGRAQTRGFSSPPIESFALADRVPLLRPFDGTAVLAGVPVAAPDGGISVDVVELPPGLSPTWLTSRWLFARHRDTRTLWMAPRVP